MVKAERGSNMNRDDWRASASPDRIERLLADLPPEVGPPVGPHLTDEELFALGLGEAEPAAWRRAVDHVATCDECAYDIALLAEDTDEWAGAGANHRLMGLVTRIVGVTNELRTQLAECLDSDDPSIRAMSAILVAGIGPKAATPAILDSLANLLQDSDPDIINLAKRAIWAMGAAAATPAILERLADMLDEPNERERGSAGSAHGVTGDAATTLNLGDLPLVAWTATEAIFPVGKGASADGRLRWRLDMIDENIRITLVSRDMGLRGRQVRIHFGPWDSEVKILGLVAKDQLGTSFVIPREILGASASGTPVRVEYLDRADTLEGSGMDRPSLDDH